nr:FAD-dependent oxidoreductase [Streptomyces sp. C1-2]
MVVGAGIAGSSAAWWLERTGWEVVLVEENRDTSRGAYLIQLDQTALGLLERMGASKIVEAASFPALAISLRLGRRPQPAHPPSMSARTGWPIEARSSVGSSPTSPGPWSSGWGSPSPRSSTTTTR